MKGNPLLSLVEIVEIIQLTSDITEISTAQPKFIKIIC